MSEILIFLDNFFMNMNLIDHKIPKLICVIMVPISLILYGFDKVHYK